MNKRIIHSGLVFLIFLIIGNGTGFSRCAYANTSELHDIEGEAGLRGGIQPLTFNQMQLLQQLPQKKIDPALKTADLPETLDNSTQPCFRPIFSQINGSCSQASAMGYTFTYEINRLRGISSDVPENQYPTHFTYNFLNNGIDGPSNPWDGWLVAQDLGIPNLDEYGGLSPGDTVTWMNGYDIYYHAMHNRVQSNTTMNTVTPEDLDNLKYWFFNRLEGAPVGGLAVFGANTIGLESDIIPADSPEAGKFIIRQWGPPGAYLADHVMTFVGYDDRIMYDFNQDGLYTNDVDINGDGVVDLKDWEIGAMIIANSWGSGWANDGFIYMPYRLLAEDTSAHGTALNWVWIMDALKTYTPILTMKIKLKHTCRNKLKIRAGISTNPDADTPDTILDFSVFNYQGGPNYMAGGTTEADKTLEFGLDVTPLLSALEPEDEVRLFLLVKEKDVNDEYDGEILEFSVINYGEDEYVTVCDAVPATIANHTTTTISAKTVLHFEKPEISTERLQTGYTGQDFSQQLSASGGNPPYRWAMILPFFEEELSSLYPSIQGDTLEVSNPDDGIAFCDLAFAFPFYGRTYDRITVSTDGSVYFEDQFLTIRSPGDLQSNLVICALAADLIQVREDHGISFSGDADGIQIRWKCAPYDDQTGELDFSMKLFPSGRVDLYYTGETAFPGGWAAGVSDGAGSFKLAAICSETALVVDRTVRLLPEDVTIHPCSGMSVTGEGLLNGMPDTVNDAWNLTFRITDISGISAEKTLPFMVCQDLDYWYAMDLADHRLNPGDRFSLKREMGNPESEELIFDEFIILDVLGNYWFWPTWSEDATWETASIDGESPLIQDIVTFDWPETGGSAVGLKFWGGMVLENTSQLLDYAWIDWEYED